MSGGATLGLNRALFQGLFHAPHVVGEALKGAHLVAATLGGLGYECIPPPGGAVHRTDIIQAVRLGEREKVLAFCRAVQRCSPVGANILPVPGVTPGYGDEVIFADGTFIDGATIELSADGPLREPYAVYVQGGTHWTHWSIVLREALRDMGPAWADGVQPGGDAGEEGGSSAAAEAEATYAGRKGLKNG